MWDNDKNAIDDYPKTFKFHHCPCCGGRVVYIHDNMLNMRLVCDLDDMADPCEFNGENGCTRDNSNGKCDRKFGVKLLEKRFIMHGFLMYEIMKRLKPCGVAVMNNIHETRVTFKVLASLMDCYVFENEKHVFIILGEKLIDHDEMLRKEGASMTFDWKCPDDPLSDPPSPF